MNADGTPGNNRFSADASLTQSELRALLEQCEAERQRLAEEATWQKFKNQESAERIEQLTNTNNDLRKELSEKEAMIIGLHKRLSRHVVDMAATRTDLAHYRLILKHSLFTLYAKNWKRTKGLQEVATALSTMLQQLAVEGSKDQPTVFTSSDRPESPLPVYPRKSTKGGKETMDTLLEELNRMIMKSQTLVTQVCGLKAYWHETADSFFKRTIVLKQQATDAEQRERDADHRLRDTKARLSDCRRRLGLPAEEAEDGDSTSRPRSRSGSSPTAHHHRGQSAGAEETPRERVERAKEREKEKQSPSRPKADRRRTGPGSVPARVRTLQPERSTASLASVAKAAEVKEAPPGPGPGPGAHAVSASRDDGFRRLLVKKEADLIAAHGRAAQLERHLRRLGFAVVNGQLIVLPQAEDSAHTTRANSPLSSHPSHSAPHAPSGFASTSSSSSASSSGFALPRVPGLFGPPSSTSLAARENPYIATARQYLHAADAGHGGTGAGTGTGLSAGDATPRGHASTGTAANLSGRRVTAPPGAVLSPHHLRASTVGEAADSGLSADAPSVFHAPGGRDGTADERGPGPGPGDRERVRDAYASKKAAVPRTSGRRGKAANNGADSVRGSLSHPELDSLLKSIEKDTVFYTRAAAR